MHDDATPECVLACVRLLRRVQSGHRIGVDADDAILREYVATLVSAPTDGLGKKLALSLWRRRYDGRVCHRLEITPLDNPPGSFAEVPVALRNFDVDDQKFLAVAIAEGGNPPVFQALDREWWHRRVDLTANGIDVQFLCVADLF
jgi:hypothetical protein